MDEKVKRILVLMQRLHMLGGTRKSGTYNTEEHRKTALEAAREPVVLLKNQKKQTGKKELNWQADSLKQPKEKSPENREEERKNREEEYSGKRAALLAARPDMVVVLVGGSPVEMGRWIGRAEAVVWGWYGGIEGGTALAEVLYGEVNPSGKLTESFYQTLKDCPAHSVGEFGTEKEVNYREGIYVGYRYLNANRIQPQFPFGHGLSYTSFSYQDARMVKEGENTFFSCLITNIGDRAGAETVQVYIRSQDSPLFQELKGFEKVMLKPKESQKVFVKLEGGWEGGRIAAGSSSEDIRILL